MEREREGGRSTKQNKSEPKITRDDSGGLESSTGKARTKGFRGGL